MAISDMFPNVIHIAIQSSNRYVRFNIILIDIPGNEVQRWKSLDLCGS